MGKFGEEVGSEVDFLVVGWSVVSSVNTACARIRYRPVLKTRPQLNTRVISATLSRRQRQRPFQCICRNQRELLCMRH